MDKIKPAEFWLKLTALSAFLLVVVFFQGVFAGGLDVAEACELGAGQPYDHEYRSQNVSFFGAMLAALFIRIRGRVQG